MKTRRPISASFFNSRANLLRVTIFIVFTILVILPLLTVFSASLSQRSSADLRDLPAKSVLPANASPTGIGRAIQKPNVFNVGLTGTPVAPFAFMPQTGPVENITILQDGCFNPSQSFQLGDTVCARIQGAPIGTRVQRRLVVVNPAGYVVAKVDVTSSSQDFTFTLPATATSMFGDVVVDTRGAWNVHGVATVDGSIRSSALLSVSDPAEPVADLAVTKFVSGPTEVAAGSTITFTVFVTNYGPDAATAPPTPPNLSSVTLTDEVPNHSTFVNQFQDSGPAFTCVNPAAGSIGTSTCTTSASFAKGDVAVLRFVYHVTNDASAGTEIVNTANVSSITHERFTPDNSSSASVVVSGTAPPETCSLGCRSNMTVTANDSQNGNAGAYVIFTSTDVINGNCGAITANPASGSFFTVGTHTVNVTSATGGGSCSFTIDVLDTPAPTITCPPDQTAVAASGENTASVDPGTPTTNSSSGVTVTSERSDDQALNAPYPVGITIITWTVKDSDGRTASCNQRITVNANDRVNLTISCPSNNTYDAEDCARTLTAAEIGTPTTNPSDSSVNVVGVRSDGMALTDPFPIGTTQITWTATDNVNGNVASCAHTVTITGSNDNTDPTITPPSDVTVSTSSCSQFVDDEELGAATATDDCTPASSITITRSGIPAGNVFPTGTTVIIYTATDASGNSATATQRVIVQESPAQPPSVVAPADVTVQAGSSATTCAAVVSDAALGSAVASDNCPGVTVARTGVPAGNVFPVGTTIVTYTATDASGNTATDTQDVTVVDNTPPTITAPPDSSASADANCQALVPDYLGGSQAADDCGNVTLAQSPSAGTLVGYGPHNVVVTADDGHGNTASDTVVFTVNDATPPMINCPANIIVDSEPGTCAAHVNPMAATAADNCGSTTVTGTRSDGRPLTDTYPVGTTTITWTATDGSGNQSSCPQTITVRDVEAPTVDFSNLTIFLNNWTIVFNTNTVTINGQVYPFDGVSCTHNGYTFTFNGQAITITHNGESNSYTLEGRTLVLWTPTHQYQQVKVEDLIASATDVCDPNVNRNSVVITQVTSDEPENAPGPGDGNTDNDIVIAPDCKSVQLRAERAHSGNGRVYTITFRVSDASGNQTRVTSKIKQRRYPFQPADDSGPQYTVTGSCP